MGWHQWTDRFYWRVQPWIVPGLRNSQHEYGDELKRLVPTACRWLDLGCGHEFLPPWMPDDERSLDLGRCRAVGIDADGDALLRHKGLDDRLRGNIESLPFRDRSFNLVTANMVLEHVQDPQTLFSEVGRVLAPGGRLLVHTPNERGYTTALTRLIPEQRRAAMATLLLAREGCDVYPTYYRANTSPILRALAEHAGLTVVSVRHVESSAQLIAVPPLLLGELVLLRALRRERLAAFRPCLLALFEKRCACPS
jgi:SAM-dependent methyltransferase